MIWSGCIVLHAFCSSLSCYNTITYCDQWRWIRNGHWMVCCIDRVRGGCHSVFTDNWSKWGFYPIPYFPSEFVLFEKNFPSRVLTYQTKSHELSISKLHVFLMKSVFDVFAQIFSFLNFFPWVVIYKTKYNEWTNPKIHVFLLNFDFTDFFVFLK